MSVIIRKNLLTLAVLTVSFLILIAATQAQTPNASIAFKKDSPSLFTLTITDPDGLNEFSIKPAGKFPYGGGLSQCPTKFSINNVSFADPADFEPMIAAITDCKGNIHDFTVAPPKDGVTRGKIIAPETPAPAEAPVESKKDESKVEVKKETLGKVKESSTLPEDIKYPIPELDNCKDETSCKLYCDDAARGKVCLAFAKKHGLLPEEEIEKAEKFFAIDDGPGDCNSQKSCEAYCSDISRIDECISFAEKNGYMEGKELAEAKKVQAMLQRGEKFPGDCTSRNACEIYCSSPDNMEECLAFAEKAGFIPEDELREAKKMMEFMKRGETPGGCRSKEQCEKYCFEEDHMDECIAFGEKAGIISPEDVEMIKKTGGKGPGNCRGKQQCEAYCEENQEECFSWAQANGLLKEEDLAQMRDGLKQFREQFENMPPQVVECFKETIGEEKLNKILAGEPVFDRDLGEKMQSCFEKLAGSFGGPPGSGGFPGGPGGPPGDFPGGGGFSGPGGCTNQEECTAYCLEHFEECGAFMPGGGGGPGGLPGAGGFPGGGATGGEFPGGGATGGEFPGGPPTGGGFSGPGGCRNVEECTAYCTEHYKDDPACSANGGGGGGGGTGSGSQSCVQRPSGLVSWWNGDAVSGATVPDLSNGNNGTISGGVIVASGKVGSGFKFNGSSGRISMGNPANLNFGTGPFSLEAWFNWDGGGSSVNNIIRKSDYSSDPGSGYWVRVGRDSGILEFSVGATTVPDGQTLITAPVSSGSWHHVVAVRDDSDTVKLYVDGQSTGSLIRQASKAQSTSGSPFALGSWEDQNSEYFSGLIDEVSVYNRALDASEVQAIFNAGSAGKCSSASSPQYQPPANYPSPDQYQQQYQQEYQKQFEQIQQSSGGLQQLPSGGYPTGSGTQYKIDCSAFAAAPKCEYVGLPGSQGYDLCKQCFPDR